MRLCLEILCCALAIIVMAPSAVAGSRSFSGPVEARVLEVLDGDTFLADALVWPGHSVRINIRIRGIDAPEMKARCPAEREAAERARNALADLLREGGVAISNISGAKYYGRVLADVAMGDGQSVAPIMLGEKLVRPYGGGRRAPWCN
jgi:micrococcal nuclease